MKKHIVISTIGDERLKNYSSLRTSELLFISKHDLELVGQKRLMFGIVPRITKKQVVELSNLVADSLNHHDANRYFLATKLRYSSDLSLELPLALRRLRVRAEVTHISPLMLQRSHQLGVTDTAYLWQAYQEIARLGAVKGVEETRTMMAGLWDACNQMFPYADVPTDFPKA